MRSIILSWAVVVFCAHTAMVFSSEKRPAKGRVNEYLARLSDERFAVREAATRALAELGTDVFPQLKQLLETTNDQELRIRLRAIVKRLALAAETDPETLAVYAREEAEAQRFAESARFYARAAAAFRDQAAQRDSEERLFWEQRAQRAELRAQRAEEWAAALCSGRVMEQAGRSFIIHSRQANGQPALEYQEFDLRLLTNW